jgi:hypothetical protein
MTASREITAEGGSAVPLRVDHVADDPAEPVCMLHCTDIEGTELRVAVREPSAAGLPPEAGEWYRFDGVARSGSPRSALVVPADRGGVERIGPPDRRPHPSRADLDDPWLVQLGASEAVVAVTVQPRPTDGVADIRAADPETFEIGAVCLAHLGGPDEATVYHREEPDTRDEHLLLQHVVRDLSEAAGATLVTRGGDRSPLEMLRTRLVAAAAGNVVGAAADRVLDGCFHAELAAVAGRTGADTLDGAARQLGVEFAPTLLDSYDLEADPGDRQADAGADGSRMSDRDYATLVERYLDADDSAAALGRCLKDYAGEDLGLLRGVAASGAADRLACSRLTAGDS